MRECGQSWDGRVAGAHGVEGLLFLRVETLCRVCLVYVVVRAFSRVSVVDCFLGVV